MARAQLVFLAVPDGNIRELCESLPWRREQSVVHCSGSLDVSVLDAARDRGAATGVFHPLQSFARDAGPASFEGISIGVEAVSEQGDLEAELFALARVLGANPFSLRGVDRAAYHSAAVFASNYVVALHALAARAFERAGLPANQARAALAPLTRGTSENIARSELHAALTGPIARGDVETVAEHLRALEHDHDLLRAYRVLGRELLGLPLTIPDEARVRLSELLSDPDSVDDE